MYMTVCYHSTHNIMGHLALMLKFVALLACVASVSVAFSALKSCFLNFRCVGNGAREQNILRPFSSPGLIFVLLSPYYPRIQTFERSKPHGNACYPGYGFTGKTFPHVTTTTAAGIATATVAAAFCAYHHRHHYHH